MNDSRSIVKSHLIRAMARLAQSVAKESNHLGWPPSCMGILYQPKRYIKAKKHNKKV